MSDPIADQLARRDRHRRKLDWAKTPEQRVAEMWQFLKSADATLRSNPAGYAHFLRRNYKKRAIRVPPTDAR
ncbi:MAG TPA: hypothetical protein VHY37_04880 [Tepidisphaeraceae bacterium]|jgi:hypothetical protein|nr:hypothetical protein [Tepidisphaeraceae bacterium]